MRQRIVLILVGLFTFLTNNMQAQERVFGTVIDIDGESINLIVKSTDDLDLNRQITDQKKIVDYLYAEKNGNILNENESLKNFAIFDASLTIKTQPFYFPLSDRGVQYTLSKEGNYTKLFIPFENDASDFDSRKIMGEVGAVDGLSDSGKRRKLWSSLFLSSLVQTSIYNETFTKLAKPNYDNTLGLKLKLLYQELLLENSNNEFTFILEALLSSKEIILESKKKVDVFIEFFDLIAEGLNNVKISNRITLIKDALLVLDISDKISSHIFNELLIHQLQGAESDLRIDLLQEWINWNKEKYGVIFDSEIEDGFNVAVEKYNLIKTETYSSISQSILNDGTILTGLRKSFWEGVGNIASKAIVKGLAAKGYKLIGSNAVLFAVGQLVDLIIELENRYDLLRLAALAGTLDQSLSVFLENRYNQMTFDKNELVKKLQLFQIHNFLGFYFYDHSKQVYEPSWSIAELLLLANDYLGFRDWDRATFLDHVQYAREANFIYYWQFIEPYYWEVGQNYNHVPWLQSKYQAYLDYIQNSSITADFTSKSNVAINETIQFADQSTSWYKTNIISWNWDLDGDGISDSYEKEPNFSYQNAGKYTVSLEVSDGVISDKIIKKDYIFATAATEGHDLGITELHTDKQWYKPNKKIDFDFLVKNYGTVNQSNIIVNVKLLNESGVTITEKEISIGYLEKGNNLIKIDDYLSIDNLEEGFYNLEAEVKLLTDFTLGNNKQMVSVYIGNENPFVTYSYDTEFIELHQSKTLGSYTVEVTNITSDKEKIKVDISKIGGGYNAEKVVLNKGEIFFYDAYRAYLKFIDSDFGAGSSEVFFQYGEYADAVTFEPSNLDVEAGSIARYIGYSNKDDSSPNVRFFDTGKDDTNEMLEWNLDSEPYKFPYNNIYVDISVPESSVRKKYDYWIRLDANGDFIRKLSMNVIAPLPGYEVLSSANRFTLAPQLTKTISLELEPNNNFTDKVTLTYDNIPNGVTVSFSDNNFSLPKTINVTFTVREDFKLFDNYSFNLNASSAQVNKKIILACEIIDASKNYISIESVKYIDKDSRTDSLKISFDSDFVYDTKAISTDWQYLSNSEWISVPSEQILNNDLRQPGKSNIVWNIQDNPKLYFKQSKFRMKNKNGKDFMTSLGTKDLHNSSQGHNEDFSGITIVNDIIYLVDIKESPVRIRTFDLDYNILRSYSLSRVPHDEHLELTYHNGYFYLHGYDLDKVWCFNSSFQLQYSKAVPQVFRTMFEMGNKIYAYYEGATDYFTELDFNCNPIGEQISTPFNEHAEFSFFDGKDLWIGYNNDLTKVSQDFQTYEENTDVLTINADYAYSYNGQLYVTKETMDLYLYSFYNPYSFYSTSEQFELNNTFRPRLNNVPILTIAEDAIIDSVVNLMEFISDTDTDIDSLKVTIQKPIKNIDLQFRDGFVLSAIPDSNWFGSGTLYLQLDDGENRVIDSISVVVNAVNDAPAVKQIPDLIVYEDSEHIFPIKNYITDIDNSYDDLSITFQILTSIDKVEEKLTISIVDSTKELKITSQNNFYLDSIEIKLSVSDLSKTSHSIFLIHIKSMNDKPIAFNRLLPEDYDEVSSDSVMFVWQKSKDIENDSLFYSLAISNNFYTKSYTTTDTTITVAIESFFDSLQTSEFYWVVVAEDSYSMTIPDNGSGVFNLLVVGVENLHKIPNEFSLSQNYPNPFNPSTTIQYDLPKEKPVRLDIYNILGEKIITLVNTEQKPGYYKHIWNGNNSYGNKVSSGIYLYRLVAGDYVKTKKMILLK